MKTRRFSLAALCIALLCSCAGPKVELYERTQGGVEKMQTWATTNSEVLEQRWGPYAVVAAGKNWIGYDAKGNLQRRRYEWVLPGVILKLTGDYLDTSLGIKNTSALNDRLQYDPVSGHINVIERGVLWAFEFAMQPDGTLYDEEKGARRSINKDGDFVSEGRRQLTTVYRSVTDEDYFRSGELARAQDRAERDAFWNGLIGGVTAAAQSYAGAQASRSTGPTAAQRELAAMTQRQQERARLAGQSTGQGSTAPQAPQARTPQPVPTATRAPVAIASTAPSRPTPVPVDSASTVNSDNLSCRPVPQKLSAVKTSRVSEDDARGQLESDRFPQCVRGPSRRLDTVDCRTEKDLPRIDAHGHQIKEAPSYHYRCFATWVCEEGKLDCGPSRPSSASRQ